MDAEINFISQTISDRVMECVMEHDLLTFCQIPDALDTAQKILHRWIGSGEAFKAYVERSMMKQAKCGHRSAQVEKVDSIGGGEGKEFFVAWLKPEIECDPGDYLGIVYDGGYHIIRGKPHTGRGIHGQGFQWLDEAVDVMLERELKIFEIRAEWQRSRRRPRPPHTPGGTRFLSLPNPPQEGPDHRSSGFSPGSGPASGRACR